MGTSNVRYLGASATSWAALVGNYQKAIPRPENRVAAALVDGFRAAYGSDDASFARFKGTGGKLDRLAWAAAGYRRPGDKFRSEAASSWWSSPFQTAPELYGILTAWAQELDRWDAKHGGAGPTTDVLAQWNPALAAGQPEELKNFLAREWEALKYARASGVEPQAPAVKLPGLKPIPTPTLPDKPIPVPTPQLPSLGLPPWARLVVIGGILYLILRKKGR